MTDRRMAVERLYFTTVTQITQPLSAPDLAELTAHIAHYQRLLPLYSFIKHFDVSLATIVDVLALTPEPHRAASDLKLEILVEKLLGQRFTSDFCDIYRSWNEVADGLSRSCIANLQLSLRWPLKNVGSVRPVTRMLSDSNSRSCHALLATAPQRFHPTPSPLVRRKIVSLLHYLFRHGGRAAKKLVFDRFMRLGMHKDMKVWTRAFVSF
ncbi:unnamed protein product [Schistocephalus solidus]|uniref:Uncharacterized protein n=1 Tax=Schistocephalus solidus TaxID=70667 RepID=A0A183SZR6_SCHSO|nr:unnamed protein product [Schistocephalus solidus]